MNTENPESDYPVALIERFAQTHHRKTPFDQLKEADRFQKMYIRSQNCHLAVVGATMFVCGAPFAILGHIYNDMQFIHFFVYALAIGFGAGFFISNRCAFEGEDYAQTRSNVLRHEAEEYLRHAKTSVDRLSSWHFDREAILLMSFGELSEAALYDLNHLRKQREESNDKESSREEILEAFTRYYKLHLIEGTGLKWVR